MDRRTVWMLTGLAAAGMGLAACGSSIDINLAGAKGQPAAIQPIAGTDRSRVVLSRDAAARLGVATATVQGAAPTLLMPAAALLYDKDGAAWVYVATQPLTYERQSVTVARVTGDVAVLQSGPGQGTQVVTVGGIELMGTETGVTGG